MIFKYDLNDTVAQAIMTKEAMVLVEGKDDHQIYQRIINHLKIPAKVYQINAFADYAAGCHKVIQAIHLLQTKFKERTEVQQLVLGVIDRDVRPYRTLMDYEVNYSKLQGLFILKYYSIETYFATFKNLARLIAKTTNITLENLPAAAVHFVSNNIIKSFNDLYLISLEALKNACEPEYDALIGYGDDESGQRVSEIKSQKYLAKKMSVKQEVLEEFANSKNVSIADIKLICKGKWFLFNYVYRASHQLALLSTACKNKNIPSCASCIVGNYEDCLFQLKMTYRRETLNFLYFDMLEFIDVEEKNDIITAFEKLGINS